MDFNSEVPAGFDPEVPVSFDRSRRVSTEIGKRSVKVPSGANHAALPRRKEAPPRAGQGDQIWIKRQ